jgi:hypothetical protein
VGARTVRPADSSGTRLLLGCRRGGWGFRSAPRDRDRSCRAGSRSRVVSRVAPGTGTMTGEASLLLSRLESPHSGNHVHCSRSCSSEFKGMFSRCFGAGQMWSQSVATQSLIAGQNLEISSRLVRGSPCPRSASTPLVDTPIIFSTSHPVALGSYLFILDAINNTAYFPSLRNRH